MSLSGHKETEGVSYPASPVAPRSSVGIDGELRIAARGRHANDDFA
jgi:hypothetical protein